MLHISRADDSLHCQFRQPQTTNHKDKMKYLPGTSQTSTWHILKPRRDKEIESSYKIHT
jgi:hypothetical protein